jgi:hypothetical protein
MGVHIVVIVTLISCQMSVLEVLNLLQELISVQNGRVLHPVEVVG